MWKLTQHSHTDLTEESWIQTQAEAVAISEARAGVPEDAGAVDLLQELFGCVFVLRNDDVSVGAAVLVDVVHGVLHAVNHLDAALEVAVLCSERLHLRRAEGQIGGETRTSMNFYLKKKKKQQKLVCDNRLFILRTVGCKMFIPIGNRSILSFYQEC